MCLTRSKLVLDQEAWNELAGMLQHVLDRGYELEREAAKRLGADDHRGQRRAGVVTMLFENMPSVPEPDAAKQPHPTKRGATVPAKRLTRAGSASA
jgi:hypothetical protein